MIMRIRFFLSYSLSTLKTENIVSENLIGKGNKFKSYKPFLISKKFSFKMLFDL